MSYVDTSLTGTVRDSYLDEVKYWLPAFLSASSTERLTSIEQVEELLHLDSTELRRVIAVHLLLSDETREFLADLPAALRSPATSSQRPRQISRVIAGGIDWAATVRARSTGSPLEPVFVTRPAVRIFDVPENRILAWVLATLARELTTAASAHQASTSGWQGDLLTMSERVASARRTTWLRSILATRPTLADLGQLQVSRKRFYKHTLLGVARLLRRYLDDPTPEDIGELLARRWFEPSKDWALFELVVLLRVERSIAALGERQRLHLTSSSAPFSTVALPSGGRTRLWYQRWPRTAGDSEQLDAARRYGIATSGSRPDIVIEVEREGASRAVLLELKATKSAEYLGAGLMQLLGYLRDRPTLFGREASAWLVAPTDAPMSSTSADGRELWVVSADGVGDAAAAAVSQLATA